MRNLISCTVLSPQWNGGSFKSVSVHLLVCLRVCQMWFLRYHWSNFEETRGNCASFCLCWLAQYSVYLFIHMSQAISQTKLIRLWINFGNWCVSPSQACSYGSVTAEEERICWGKHVYSCLSFFHFFPHFPSIDSVSRSVSLSAWHPLSSLLSFNLWWMLATCVKDELCGAQWASTAYDDPWPQTAQNEALWRFWEGGDVCLCVFVLV